jgi:hypothetical protein
VTYRLLEQPVSDRSAKAVTLCTASASLDARMQTECVHGLGHAAWQISESDAAKGYTSLCSGLPSSMRAECATGVMMDWSLGWRERQVIRPVVTNPRELCDSFPVMDAHRCPFYIADIALGLQPGTTVERAAVDEYLTWCREHPYRLENPDWLLECGSSTGAALHSNRERRVAFDALQANGFERNTLLKFIALAWPRALYWGDLQIQSRLCADLGVDERTCEDGKMYLEPSAAIDQHGSR